MKTKNDEDYAVGYKKPPTDSQFTKGKSGNPSGRPKREKDFLSVLDKEFKSKLIVNENGARKKISKYEALAKQCVNKAIAGTPASIKVVSLFLAQIDKRLIAEAISSGSGKKNRACQVSLRSPEENEHRIMELLEKARRPRSQVQ